MCTKYKYSLSLKGNTNSLTTFHHKLIDLGYSTQNFQPINAFYISTYNDGRFWIQHAIPEKSDYNFNIDNKWEFESALAIAAIRDDNKPYVGEWVIGTFSEKLEKGKWAKIIEVENRDHIHRGFNIDKISTKDWQLNIDGYYCRKATPEEIITYMKEKYLKIELPTKWCIANEVGKDKPDVVEWFNKQFGWKLDWKSFPGYYKHFPGTYNKGKAGMNYNSIQHGYTEITYEQWKAWYDQQQKEEVMRKPKNWYVKCGSPKEIKEVWDYVNEFFSNSTSANKQYTYFGIHGNARAYHNPSFVGHRKEATYYESIEEWRKVFKPELMCNKKIIGYKLIKQYPNSPVNIGQTLLNTNGGVHRCEAYPEFWQPIYEEEKKEEVLIIGSENVKVTIKQGDSCIHFEGNALHINLIRTWYCKFTGELHIDEQSGLTIHIKLNKSLSAKENRIIKYGCTWLSLAEIENIITVYDRLNG